MVCVTNIAQPMAQQASVLTDAVTILTVLALAQSDTESTNNHLMTRSMTGPRPQESLIHRLDQVL